MPQRLPLFASGSSYKGPFIHDQALRWLDAPADRRFECLDPNLFRAARQNQESEAESENDPTEKLPAGCQWVEVSSVEERLALLNDKSRLRTCLLIEAGIGKTTAMQQIAYLHNDPQGHLAIGFPFSHLPDEAEAMLDREGDSFLVRMFCENEATRNAPKDAIARLIQRKIRAGQFSLIVDALDQTSGVHDVPKLARALHGFLVRYPNVRCIVSGRPTSVLQRQHDLFEGGDWCFVQLMEFTPEQQEFYVGTQRWTHMQRLESDLLAQPRTGEEVRKLLPSELAEIRTASELHYTVLQKTLRSSTQEQKEAISIDEAEILLALIAFGMHEEDNFDGVDSDDFRPFVGRLFRRHQSVPLIQDFYADANALITRIQELGKLNEFLEFAFLEQTKETQLYFRNRAVQDFLAALWLSRYSCTAAEQNWLRDHLHLWGKWGSHHQEAQRYQFWRFLTGMPQQAMDKKRVHWLTSIQTLFMPAEAQSAPTRSTEMIYRSLWNLVKIAGKMPSASAHSHTGRLVERDLWNAIDQLQLATRGEYARGNLRFDPHVGLAAEAQLAAQQILHNYLTEMLARCDGSHPNCDAPDMELAELDQRGFVDVPAGQYWFGDNSNEENILTLDAAMEMAKFPLTNSIVNRFDPIRPQRFDDCASFSKHENCPAIYLNWYDAFCIAMWLHARLPDEYQWERGCRGDQTPPRENHLWHSGPTEQDLGQVAWYYSNSGRETHPVGGADEEKLPNSFGLYHMHGNVWEWTSNWYAGDHRAASASDFVGWSRVLRGGSFDCTAYYCRSAARNIRQPSICYDDSGVRLARARKS
ncbi:MAG: SUMF1/EgtB/PvdO family nonheme iron enzyme [Planctomycetota bacterium]